MPFGHRLAREKKIVALGHLDPPVTGLVNCVLPNGPPPVARLGRRSAPRALTVISGAPYGPQAGSRPVSKKLGNFPRTELMIGRGRGGRQCRAIPRRSRRAPPP